nr:triple QxxK/R motif-containing protein isoform X2 [Microcebus murinus]
MAGRGSRGGWACPPRLLRNARCPPCQRVWRGPLGPGSVSPAHLLRPSARLAIGSFVKSDNSRPFTSLSTSTGFAVPVPASVSHITLHSFSCLPLLTNSKKNQPRILFLVSGIEFTRNVSTVSSVKTLPLETFCPLAALQSSDLAASRTQRKVNRIIKKPNLFYEQPN